MTLVERTQQFPGAQLTDDQVRRVFVKSVVKRPTIHERLMFWPDLHKSSIETVIEKAISLSLTAERVIRDVQSSGHGAPISRAPHKETGVERLAPSNFPRVTEQRFGFKTNQSSHHMETRTNAPPNSPKATEQRFGPKTNQGNHHIETKTNAQPWRRNQGRNNLQVSFADEALNAENNVHPDRRVNITPMDNNVKARRVGVEYHCEECVTITFPGAVSRPAKLDTGADILIISMDTIRDMSEAGISTTISPTALSSIVYGLEDHRVKIIGQVVISELWLTRLTGSVRLINVRAYVIENSSRKS